MIIEAKTELSVLYETARRELVGKGEERIFVALEKTLQLESTPDSLKQLIKMCEADITEFNIEFGHYKEFERLPSVYTFSVQWKRPQENGAVINSLHFTVSKEAAEIVKFFPLDSKTAIFSTTHFPYPLTFPVDQIPPEDYKAMEQYGRLNELLMDPEFRKTLLLDLISVFQQNDTKMARYGLH